MQSVADILAEGIQNAGTARIFGVPGGGSSLELIEAARRSQLRFVLCHQESSACIMAAVSGELTRTPGAALVGLGPGVASAVNGLAYALLDRAPMVVFTDRHPENVRPFTTHQALDQPRLIENVSKARWIVDAATAREQIAEAVELCLADPPGPVHMELSSDVASASVSASALPEHRDSDPAHIPDVNRAAEQIRSSRRPVLLVGLQCRDDTDAREVRALATRLGAPVLTTYKAKGILPEDHPLHAGIITGAVVEQSVVSSADRIVAVGLDAVELIPKPWAYQSPVLHINRESSLPRYYRPDITLTGALDAILHELTRQIGSDTVAAWDPEEPARLKRAANQLLSPESGALAPHRVAELCRERSPRNAIAVVDSGAHMFPMVHFWTAYDPQSFLISNGLATMGFALPAAIAAQLVHPERRVLCFTGDGGLMMVAAEMETVKRLGLPIVVVVFNDYALSLIQIKQEQKGYGSRDMSYGGPDFTALARSFGWAGFSAASETELGEALDAAFTSDVPTLIDARIDSSGYRQMLEAIRGAPPPKTEREADQD